MKLFIDSANPGEIKKMWEAGIIDGVTTNPSLATKAGIDYKQAVNQILATVNGDISLEVFATVRSPLHVKQAALAGCDIATCPYEVLDKLVHHPLTDIGLTKFLDDFKESGQKPLVLVNCQMLN